MKIRNIHVNTFRNHTKTDADFGAGINVLLGDNGEGKTNLLEAISYLCLTKSFFGSSDDVVLQIGQRGFDLSADMEADTGVAYHVGVSYHHAEAEKTFAVNKARVEKFSDVVGQFPVVVLSPEAGAVTMGGPADRRRFLDFVISQSSKVYLEDLLEYRRVLRQRNKILLDSRIARSDPGELLEPWNEELVDRGARITLRRRSFLGELGPLVEKAYGFLVGETERPGLRYLPAVNGEQAEGVLRDAFRAELKRKLNEEKRLAVTLVGPHRDEIALQIDDLDVRLHASQGQHKTMLIALKVAEFWYLQQKRSERPILLLDDVFTELDNQRAARLLEMTASLGQAFITTTSSSIFTDEFMNNGKNRRFVVRKGAVEYENARNVAG